MDDLISRRMAVEALYDWELMYTWDEHCKEEPDAPYIVSPSKVINGLPPAQLDIAEDGTLIVTVPKGTEVGRVLVQEEGTTNGALYYRDTQPEEVIPHRNYKYLPDYWCECGWHLGKRGDVKYCAECGRKVNWDG